MDGHDGEHGPLPADALRDIGADPWIGAQSEPEPGARFRPVILDAERRGDRPGRTLPSRPSEAARAWRPEPAVLEAEPVLRRHGRVVEPLTIINHDDRQPYNDWRYPWGLVCRMTGFRPGFGSGVLVGPRHVLTASHVVDWRNKVGNVDIHRFDGTVRATARVISAYSFTELEGVDSSTVDEDYAVCVLDSRWGDVFGWMGTREYDSSWDDRELWQSIGYASDMAGGVRPEWLPSFYLDEDELDLGSGRAMETNADVVGGQSGSPVFAWWGEIPYVVAVVSAVDDGENYCAGGSDLPRLVNDARSSEP